MGKGNGYEMIRIDCRPAGIHTVISISTTATISSSSFINNCKGKETRMWRWIGFCSILLFAFSFQLGESKIKEVLVTEFDKKSGSSIFGGKEHLRFAVLIESKESEDYDDHLDEFTKAAKKFEDKVRFVYINSDVEENWQVIEFLGLIAEDVPDVLFIDLEKGLKKYKAEMNEISKAEIVSFVQSCLDGETVPFLKSEDIPEDWDKGPVIQLVGKNFEEQVFNKKKNAPWCAACYNTIPEVKKLGELYKDKKTVIIAKMNAVSNEVPGIPIFDVPTIALFIKGSRKPVYHTEDDRTANSFSRFITANLKEANPSTEFKKSWDNPTDKMQTEVNDGKNQLTSKDEL